MEQEKTGEERQDGAGLDFGYPPVQGDKKTLNPTTLTMRETIMTKGRPGEGEYRGEGI